MADGFINCSPLRDRLDRVPSRGNPVNSTCCLGAYHLEILKTSRGNKHITHAVTNRSTSPRSSWQRPPTACYGQGTSSSPEDLPLELYPKLSTPWCRARARVANMSHPESRCAPLNSPDILLSARVGRAPGQANKSARHQDDARDGGACSWLAGLFSPGYTATTPPIILLAPRPVA